MDLAPYGICINSFTPTATQVDNPEMVTARAAAGVTALFPFLGFAGMPGQSRRANAGGHDHQLRTGGTADFVSMSPLGELPTPTDYGHVIAFLCSDFARLITGSDYAVDSGALAKYWPYVPPTEKAGPLTLIKMDVTEA